MRPDHCFDLKSDRLSRCAAPGGARARPPQDERPAGRASRVALTALTAAAALLAAGCGSSASPLRAVIAAATRTLRLSAVSNLTLEGSGFGSAGAPVLGQGEFRFASGLGYQALDLQPAPGRPAGREFLLYLPGRAYLEPPAAWRALPRGRSWLVASLAASRARRAGAALLVGRLEAADPQLLLDEIAWGAARARAQGTRVVDHVPLSEYVVSVSLARTLAAATAHGASGVAAAVRAQLGPSVHAGVATVRAWVDVAGRVAMLATTLPGQAPRTVELALSGFGTAIAATPNLPLARELVELAALAPAKRARAVAPWVGGGG